MSELKTRTINNIIKIEGGFVDDPSDSGGATKYGITEKVARENYYTGDMQQMPMEIARKIYEDQYWEPLQLSTIELLSSKIAEEIVDTGVNQGVNRAATFLQRSLTVLNKKGEIYPDLTIDGQLGQKSVRALDDYLAYRGNEGETVLLRMLNALQGAFYVELCERREKDEKYIYGWFNNRVVM